MHFRPAYQSETITLVDFQLAMAWETEQLRLEPNIVTAGVTAVFEQPQHGCYYVVEDEQQIVGSTLITFEWSDWRNGNVWWIQSVYVQPEFRRRGVYRFMYAQLQSLVQADPTLRGLRLYVDKRNLAAQQTYNQLGMNGEHYQVFEWMKS